MKIAITGARGLVGRPVVEGALKRGHSVVAIDRTAATVPDSATLRSLTLDMADYDAVVAGFAGCDAVIHLAAIPQPFGFPDHVVHNNNVVGSYNALRAAVENGIERVCQASSVNAAGLSFSREAHFDYLPLDEHHPTYNEEAYGLSKWICEMQADSFARRYERMRIASLRFHLVVEDRDAAKDYFKALSVADLAKHLWAYTHTEAAVRASLASLEADFSGHEVFYIAAPDTMVDEPSAELVRRYFPNVEVRAPLPGRTALFSSAKAERMLGLTYPLD